MGEIQSKLWNEVLEETFSSLKGVYQNLSPGEKGGVIERLDKSVTMRNDWRHLPISQVWKLSIIDENKIDWEVNIVYKEDATLDMEKVGIMLSEKYDKWIVGDREGEFKPGRTWQEINFKEIPKRQMCARNTSSSRFPDVILDYSVDGISGISQIQSSSRDLNARFININLVSQYYYKRGDYYFFKGRIHILESNQCKDIAQKKR